MSHQLGAQSRRWRRWDSGHLALARSEADLLQLGFRQGSCKVLQNVRLYIEYRFHTVGILRLKIRFILI